MVQMKMMLFVYTSLERWLVEQEAGCFLPMSCLLREVISDANRRSMIQGYLISSNALESVVKPEIVLVIFILIPMLH